jgi:hypothetical protein
VIIQHCESHHNHAGLTKDGGGFDIDGGSSNCILQYNYSHDNEGAGFLLAEYGAELPFRNNTVRFNISENDGRKNSYGSISIWGVDSNHRVNESYVYNNTIYSDEAGIVDGLPAALTLFGNNFRHVLVANNIFFISGRTQILNADAAFDTSAIYFLGNNYSQKDFKLAGQAQETYNGMPTGIFIVPALKSGVKGIAKFHLQNAAAFQNKGMDLRKVFAIDIGNKDLFGESITHAAQLVGATVR